jgi:hypothetical protein
MSDVYSAGTVTNAIAVDLAAEKMAKGNYAREHSCTKCSKATRYERVLPDEEGGIPYPESTGVTILHDVVYDCENKYHTQRIYHNCLRGDNNFNMEVCETCRYGEKCDIKYTKGSGIHEMHITQTLYKCKHESGDRGRPGEYCTYLMSCDHYERKEKENGEKDR